MGVSEMDGIMVDSEKWVIALRNPLKPIFTKSMEKKKDAEKEYCSTTPTSAESRIPSRLSGPPPPPKKRKPSSNSRCRRRGVMEFFNPPDLETIFIPRVHDTTANLNY